MRHKLIKIEKASDIPARYRNTPIGLLLQYHNLNRKHGSHASAQLLIGMCMDSRKHLHIPEKFAYTLRTGGANLRYNTFDISYVVSVGGIRHIALIGHNDCGMVNLISKKEKFINGLVRGAGWKRSEAEDHFMSLALMHEIGNELDFIVKQANWLREIYPKVKVAPLFYKLEDNKLYCI